MGLFGDAFDISAGATLGNLAVKSGYQAAEEFLNVTEKNAYNKLRSKDFDPVLRQDLNDIIVCRRLQARKYPFPQAEVKKKENFFVRHKVFLIGTIIFFIIFMFVCKGVVNGMSYERIYDTVQWYMAFVSIYVTYKLSKKIERGKKKLMESSYKPKLVKDGQQYWHVREYVRQSLASGQMSVQDAIIKISNTELGRQFPDTMDEIEANAFFYKQKLGL